MINNKCRQKQQQQQKYINVETLVWPKTYHRPMYYHLGSIFMCTHLLTYMCVCLDRDVDCIVNSGTLDVCTYVCVCVWQIFKKLLREHTALTHRHIHGQHSSLYPRQKVREHSSRPISVEIFTQISYICMPCWEHAPPSQNLWAYLALYALLVMTTIFTLHSQYLNNNESQ